MAYFKRDRFSGIAPGVAPRLLSEQFGQIAENVDLESGRLVATKQDSDAYDLQTHTRRSIYKYEAAGVEYWLEWYSPNVSVVPGPIPGDTTDRLYFSGGYTNEAGTVGGYPRVGNSTTLLSSDPSTAAYFPVNSFRLGVPAPTDTPVVTVSGTADDNQTPNDVAYVYTFVTAFGEEGPPSPASAIVQLTDTETTSVSTPSHATGGNYNFGTGAKKRLYRSNTGSTNTTFQFVAEVNYSEVSITDALDAAELGEVLPSSDWIGPPDDDSALYPDGPLKSLIPLAQGVMAGFTGKRFCLSEPFLPHAWPIAYRITTEEDIVAIASTANGVAALTDGKPYFITGTSPVAMTAVQIDLAQACVNINSVVDMGDYVLYAGPDGLCAVQSASGEVVTAGIISVQQWNNDFYPTSIKAFKHEGTYVAFYTSGSTFAGWVYDPRGSENALTTFTMAEAVRGGYSHPKTGELFIIQGGKIRKFRDITASSQTLKFKSKKFVTPSPVSMSWVSLHANTYPASIKVFADGTLVSDYSLSYSGNVYTQTTTVPSGISTGTLAEPVMRMPAVVGQEWEIQVEGTDINEFCLAQSMDEIRGT